MNEEVLKRLLTPLTDEEARDLPLITKKEMQEAIDKVDRVIRTQQGGYRIWVKR